MRLVVSLALLLCECGNFTETKGSPPGPSNFAAQAEDFAAIQKDIFGPACVRCHDGYREYANVRRDLAAIVDAVNAGRMPKGGTLTNEIKLRLAAWAASGAPEKQGEPPPPIVAPKLTPDYASLHEFVFEPLCAICHNPRGRAKFLDLSTREAMWAARAKLFDFEQPEKSPLLEVLADDAEPMPPKRSNLRRLTQEEMDVIKLWIAAGVP